MNEGMKLFPHLQKRDASASSFSAGTLNVIGCAADMTKNEFQWAVDGDWESSSTSLWPERKTGAYPVVVVHLPKRGKGRAGDILSLRFVVARHMFKHGSPTDGEFKSINDLHAQFFRATTYHSRSRTHKATMLESASGFPSMSALSEIGEEDDSDIEP
uniref:Uncharacterized protein n=1 Tax=Lotharella oceanica TaxID=641309 RepID=A0A7S2U1U6_9EUKA|mmetsp:Transcript_4613/g.9253  ORF Transcript_4613/g.9253 Transcript_4613/m.9253 type:complete len:158 (+) Transcript_4613:572-1045(+)|eukprot:CAMPEP_0170172020 /NCGR_PEP_ID=MMETSP0040_2-20121228/5237_1 /TAXON_ID=641309 /ORGANISM="Lotharella oceanica, Strain CCMP622" /LENGTH=157 /DNA_ID=CAMNT_0010412437 /DNA_START=550 /DNA_END=1023 /DNA_ORIENTATION=+